MNKILLQATKLFLWIFGFTAALTLCGVAYVWFMAPDTTRQNGLPYLHWLLGILIAEVVTLVIGFVSRGMRYLPSVRTDKTAEATLRFMEEFIAFGSSVTIISNRISWLAKADDLIRTIVQKAEAGVRFEIITPKPVTSDLVSRLQPAGVEFYVTHSESEPEARFTLINANRSGAEKLAIARGTHPDHEITVFDNNSGPQIIAMAKDIIAVYKGKARAASVE